MRPLSTPSNPDAIAQAASTTAANAVSRRYENTPPPDVRWLSARLLGNTEADQDFVAAYDGPKLLLTRPTKKPETVWNRLSEVQRLAAWAKDYADRVRDIVQQPQSPDSSDKPLSPAEGYLCCLGWLEASQGNADAPRLSPQAADLTLRLWQASGGREVNNPTWPDVTACLQRCLDTKQPITLSMSQCLNKPDGLWGSALQVSTQERKPAALPRLYDPTTPYTPKGWAELQRLQQALGDTPSVVELLLGDQDVFTFGLAEKMTTYNVQLDFRTRMDALKADVTQQAEAFFGPGNVRVLLWSDLFKLQAFKEALIAAQTTQDTWYDADFQRDMEQYYLGSWGAMYRELCNKLGILTSQLPRFVRDQTALIATQYSLEAQILRGRNCLQVWGAETTMPPSLCMRISSYDQAKQRPLPGTLILPKVR
jgi:hypothetical protein